MKKLHCPAGCKSGVEPGSPYPGLEKQSFLGIKEILKCTKCGLRFASPMPSTSELASFYEGGHYYHVLDPFATAFFEFSVELAKTRLELALRYIKLEEKRILDVGAGNGAFGYAARERKIAFSYNVVEPEPSLAAKYGSFVDQVYSHLDNVQGKFDLITLFQVLEHVNKPGDFISQVCDLLAPGGLLFIEVPHRDDLFKNNVVPHTLFWEKSSLYSFLAKQGFEIVFLNTAGMPHRRAKKYFSASHWFQKARHLIFYLQKLNSLLLKLKIPFRFSTFWYFSAGRYDGNRQWLRAIVTKQN